MQLAVKPGGTLIFTAATKGFIPSLINWITLLYRLGVKDVFVYSMDDVRARAPPPVRCGHRTLARALDATLHTHTHTHTHDRG